MRNPVAKFQRRYNKAQVFTDRKREAKKTGNYKLAGRQCLDDDFYDSANGFKLGEYNE